ncbi:sucrose-6-phosphate hydrolase [Aerococcaceae bacterium DSM 111022]|nr:sucrose-6-phosphate hydrolase [Aerococcaceae bacterium DSM 111022]
MEHQEDQWRLKYHLMPETGWLNDPNGAVQFNGKYHIYYQYVPEDPNGGATHWGHQTSTDLVHFHQEPIFMSPDQTFDIDGVYSGGSIVHDEVIHYFYTGNVKKPGDYDYIYNGREQNVVHVTSRDGYTVDKREVVIPHAEFPDGYTDHIRDPKIIEDNGNFYMVLGARRCDNRGSILLYVSENLEDWDFKGELIVAEDDEGYMWECPDLLFIDGQAILIYSPQGILPTEYKYQNTHVAGYRFGDVDFEAATFTPTGEFYELDYGFDFYAPHTFEDEAGRRIQLAWMGLGDTMPEYTNPTINRGWQHALTIPRELTIEAGKLYQRPFHEYEGLRQEGVQTNVNDQFTVENINDIYEAVVELPEQESFEIRFGEDSQLVFEDKKLALSHGPSGYGRRKRIIEVDAVSNIQLFVDTSAVEIYINDGEYVMSSRYYPSENADLRLELYGKAQVTYYPLIPSKDYKGAN